MIGTHKLLVFDWDGTLMDSAARIVNSMQAAMRDAGLPVREPGEIRNIIGLGLSEAICKLYPEIDATGLERMQDGYRHHFLHADSTPMALFEGARETLDTLKNRGYWLAVATGKSRAGLDRALEETGLAEHFYVTRCADETCSKPAPQMLEEIMVDFDTEPGHTLMIGDSEYDMLMARNAGTAALAVSYGVHTRERLLEHGALDCIDEVTELSRMMAGPEPDAVA